ncbi:MAG: pyrroline-5-carboxylate reductase [Rhodospirillales bacterium]
MTSVLLVGCGKMGGALLAGWRANNAADSFVVVEPMQQSLTDILGVSGVTVVKEFSEIPGDFKPNAIVMAVKPQAMNEVAPPYADLAKSALTLSIAAGTPIAFFEKIFGADAAIVRAMPNTPAAIGRGMSVLCANAAASDGQKNLSEVLMQAAGAVEWISDEGLMDAVTALSGSGPAYVFHLIEAMAAAGQALGLDAELAAKAALETVAGAGELARQARETPSVLRQNVTSPGGTTAAALSVLMAENGMSKLMEKAMTAARDRGRELAAN